ncbi:TPA: hypothetical protein N2826_004055 [Vibrio parahaemolyticus]|uniref:hypothetical protein n=1 Tax=Vibrio parahaemolyticus TaxID=670 RepID=UPI0015DDC1EF|nr:hypothetical protein [Vibrio parahaemolyticus]HCM0883570.1 hypothetical protein [Vibrio parahaemolyticus]
MMNKTAQSIDRFSTSTLRRGFFGDAWDGGVISPRELITRNQLRLEECRKERAAIYERMGRPNKKNLKARWKGKEFRLGSGHSNCVAKFFSLGDEVESLSKQNMQVKKWLKENTPQSTELECMMKAIYEVVDTELAKRILEKARRDFQSAVTPDDEKWRSFLELEILSEAL